MHYSITPFSSPARGIIPQPAQPAIRPVQFGSKNIKDIFHRPPEADNPNWFRRRVLPYAFSLSLLAGGLTSTTVGVVGSYSNDVYTGSVTAQTNPDPDNLDSPVLLEDTAELQLINGPETEPSLIAATEISFELAKTYAEGGRLESIEPQGGIGNYALTVKVAGTEVPESQRTVTVSAKLTPDQYDELFNLSAFKPGIDDPAYDPVGKQPLPDRYAGAISAGALSNYAEAGQVLSMESKNPVSGTGQDASEERTFEVVLTDGKEKVTVDVVLDTEQSELIAQAVSQNPAYYRSYEKDGGFQPKGHDIVSLLLGLSLTGAGLGAGAHTRNKHLKGRPTEGSEAEMAQKISSYGFKKIDASLRDVRGLSDETQKQIRSLINILRHTPGELQKKGVKPIKSFLLHGTAGTAKTKLCQIIAGETGRYYLSINISELITKKYTGTGSMGIKENMAIIKQAAETGLPLLIQIDEIDAVLRNRDKAHDEDVKTVNTWLQAFDELTSIHQNVTFAYTSNYRDTLDGAASRSGRLDEVIKVPPPATDQQRLEILELYATKPYRRKLSREADLHEIAHKTFGFTGADLEALMNKAAIYAMDQGAITQEHLLEALHAVERQRKSDGMTLTSMERPNVTFDDLGGLDEIIPIFRDIAEQLSKMAQGTTAVPDGHAMEEALQPALLTGSSGTGKTQIARAIAGEANCNFMSINGADFGNEFQNSGKEKVKEVFALARENRPTIIFIDEADAVFSKRSSGPNSHKEREATLNQLLTEMDGLKPNDGVLVIAATNRPDIFDEAALSRFQVISVPRPGLPAQRRQILDILTRNVPLADNVDLDELARYTRGYSGRDLKSMIRLAVKNAKGDEPKTITRDDFANALDEFELGKKSQYPVERKDLELVGIHEMLGHGLITMALKRRFPDVKVRAVTMEPRRPKADGETALGFVRPEFPDGISGESFAHYLAQILVAAGGRASERAILGKEQEGTDTSGGANDSEKIEKIIIHMLQSGMIPGFSPNHFAKSKQELTPEERGVIDFITGQAEQFSEEIIRTADRLYPEKLKQVVAGGIEAGTVRNEKAEGLYTGALDERDWQPLYDLVDQYIATVIGTLKNRARQKQAQFLKDAGIEA